MSNDFDTSQYPLGSMHPYVLYNNAGNEDLVVNDVVNETWIDRPPFNRVRKTLYGMEQEFLRALAKMGYETTYLTYVDGSPLQVDRPTQLIARDGSVYAVKLPNDFPVMLTGTWATDAPLLVDVGDQSLRTALAATGGGEMIGWERSSLSGVISTVGGMLSAQEVNIWEFANLVTNKPDPADSNTWDWTPAVQAAADSIVDPNIYPTTGSLTLRFKAGYAYPITSVVFGSKVNIQAAGAVFRPFDVDATATHLMKFSGFNNVYNLTIDMGFALNYDSAIWMRGRHSTFVGCAVWKGRYCWQFGDPAWATNPANGHLGDSENVLTSCKTVWSITAVKAYGQNTIVDFNSCLMYTYRNAMSQFDPTNPNLATWNALPERTFINCGALLYINGGTVANFTGVSPVFFSQLQPVTDPAYKNSFGRFYVTGTHIESGFHFECDSVGAYTADDSTTTCLRMIGANGHMATTAGNRINLGGNCQQGAWVDACDFYGGSGNALLYAAAGTAKVHVDPNSYKNITVDFFQALHGKRLINYDNLCVANVTSSAQTVTSTLAAIVMPTRAASDIWTSFEPEWYSTSTGTFSPRSDMRNVSFALNMLYPSGVSTDITNAVLLVNGVQQDTQASYGANPRPVLRAKAIPAGANVVIQVSCSTSRALSGNSSTRLMVTGNV